MLLSLQGFIKSRKKAEEATNKSEKDEKKSKGAVEGKYEEMPSDENKENKKP